MKLIVKVFFLLIFLCVVSCSDIFEESIEDKNVILLEPADNLDSKIYGQTFRWDPVKGALKYNLQIVSPNFPSSQSILLDTLISTTSFVYSLDPGIYQWRVRAQNGSSKTSYFTRSLEIGNSTLASQTLMPIAPYMSNGSDVYISNPAVTFKWQKLFGTQNYNLQIDTITGSFTGLLKVNTLISAPALSASFDFPYDGKFKWRVKAQNLPDESAFSTGQNFIVDTKAPSKLSNLFPGSNTFYDRPFSLKWNVSPFADVLKYKVYVYDRDTILLGQFPREVIGRNNSSFLFDTYGVPGDKIVWRVTAVDHAGNESDYSNYGYFSIGE